ncbi:MAG: type III secretion system stator protein SctL [Myxococcota bacterium]
MPKVIKRGPGGPPERPSAEPPAGHPSAPSARPKKRIIEREVVGATHEARRIVQEAEAEAQRILEEAREAATETHQRGFERGREDGKAEFTQALSAALLRVRQIEENLEGEYIGLVRDCVEKILGQELQQSPAAILGVVRNALLDARQQREITVRVHPEDAAVLEKNQPRLLEVLARANAVDVRRDPGVTRGGCIVSTELGTIDARLERQLDALAAAVHAELGEGGGSGYHSESELDPEDDPGAGY